MFNGFIEEFPDAKNLIKLEFYREHIRDRFSHVGEFHISKIRNKNDKEYYFDNKELILNSVINFLIEKINDRTTILHETKERDCIYNAIIEISDKNIIYHSYGCDEELPEKMPLLRIVY